MNAMEIVIERSFLAIGGIWLLITAVDEIKSGKAAIRFCSCEKPSIGFWLIILSRFLVVVCCLDAAYEIQ